MVMIRACAKFHCIVAVTDSWRQVFFAQLERPSCCHGNQAQEYKILDQQKQEKLNIRTSHYKLSEYDQYTIHNDAGEHSTILLPQRMQPSQLELYPTNLSSWKKKVFDLTPVFFSKRLFISFKSLNRCIIFCVYNMLEVGRNIKRIYLTYCIIGYYCV